MLVKTEVSTLQQQMQRDNVVTIVAKHVDYKHTNKHMHTRFI